MVDVKVAPATTDHTDETRGRSPAGRGKKGRGLHPPPRFQSRSRSWVRTKGRTGTLPHGGGSREGPRGSSGTRVEHMGYTPRST